ncbi:DUF805 domain-containing protein [Psittacicella gerlachiana]|uniref:DUF805 domain-containing protein n=1 Tax=Psittacicella gerlachiana TaxID=2028574 RepID=A0A3A1YC37_9GAMM|nr:hypothetical protein [Psittacicella gerlachiana]RIY34748.1 hypothetical protein CKF59_04885 [Psittacicella gerlachiana]
MSHKDFPEYLPFVKNFFAHYQRQYYFNYRGKENLYMFWRFACIPLIISFAFYILGSKLINFFAQTFASNLATVIAVNLVYLAYLCLIVLPTTAAISRRLNANNQKWTLAFIYLISLLAFGISLNATMGVQGYFGTQAQALFAKLTENYLLLTLCALYPIPLILCATDKKLAQETRAKASNNFNWQNNKTNPHNKQQESSSSKNRR